MTRTAVAAICSTLLLAACGGREPPPAPRAEEGREETRSIRSTEAIGYAGDAIADEVDAALDANERRKQNLDEAIDDQTN